MDIVYAVIALVLILFALITVIRSVRVVPQARVAIVQRLGRYLKTADSGPLLVIPFMDKVLPMIDMREQVVTFDRQSVITADNVGIQIDTVIYYQIIDPRRPLTPSPI